MFLAGTTVLQFLVLPFAFLLTLQVFSQPVQPVVS